MPQVPSAAPVAASQAQFTPLAGLTARTVQTLRQTIGQVHPHRAANPAPTPPKVVETKFLVRIAHGSYEISISSLDTLPSLHDLLGTGAPPLASTMPETAAAIVSEPATEPAKPAPKQAANRAHKRQISEAIPRNERADAGEAHLEKEDHTHWRWGRWQ